MHSIIDARIVGYLLILGLTSGSLPACTSLSERSLGAVDAISPVRTRLTNSPAINTRAEISEDGAETASARAQTSEPKGDYPKNAPNLRKENTPTTGEITGGSSVTELSLPPSPPPKPDMDAEGVPELVDEKPFINDITSRQTGVTIDIDPIEATPDASNNSIGAPQVPRAKKLQLRNDNSSSRTSSRKRNYWKL